MAHHKRYRPKQQRGGCLHCKPHKANCSKDSAASVLPRDRRRMEPIDLADAIDEIVEADAMPGPHCPCEQCRLEYSERAA